MFKFIKQLQLIIKIQTTDLLYWVAVKVATHLGQPKPSKALHESDVQLGRGKIRSADGQGLRPSGHWRTKVSYRFYRSFQCKFMSGTGVKNHDKSSIWMICQSWGHYVTSAHSLLEAAGHWDARTAVVLSGLDKWWSFWAGFSRRVCCCQ